MASFSHHNNQEWELGQTSAELGMVWGHRPHRWPLGHQPEAAPLAAFVRTGVSCNSKWGDPEEKKNGGDEEFIPC